MRKWHTLDFVVKRILWKHDFKRPNRVGFVYRERLWLFTRHLQRGTDLSNKCKRKIYVYLINQSKAELKPIVTCKFLKATL